MSDSPVTELEKPDDRVNVLKRGWANFFYPRMALDGARPHGTDEYVVPFAMIFDGTLTGGGDLDSEAWVPGPLPFFYPSLSHEIKKWNPGDDVYLTAGESNATARSNHFSPRVSRLVYAKEDDKGQTLRRHHLLEEPWSLDGDFAVRGVRIWALEVLQATGLQSSIVEGSCCVVVHLEAIADPQEMRHRGEVDEDALGILLYEVLRKRVMTAVSVLGRDRGRQKKLDVQVNALTGESCRENEATGQGPSAEREPTGSVGTVPDLVDQLVEPTGGGKGRFEFVDYLEKKIAAIFHPTASARPTILLRVRSDVDVKFGESVRADDKALVRRCYSVVPFVAPPLELLESSALAEEDKKVFLERWESGSDTLERDVSSTNRVLNSLITGNDSYSTRSKTRADTSAVEGSQSWRYLVLRDGSATVMTATDDGYNLPCLVYTLGVRLDQFLVGRLSSRLLEAFGIAMSHIGLKREGDLEKRREDTRELADNIARLDQDLVTFGNNYWQVWATSGQKSNEMLTDYRKQMGDEKVLQSLNDKRDDLLRIVTLWRAQDDAEMSARNKTTLQSIASVGIPGMFASQLISIVDGRMGPGYQFLLWLGIVLVGSVILWQVFSHFANQERGGTKKPRADKEQD